MKFNLILFIALVCVFLPLSTHAGEFVGLVGIPGIEPNGDTDLNAYINALYRLSISIAALLAVIKIVAAGAKYMLTDIVPAKEEAKKDIQGALIGLLIVIGAIIILNTVNSDLTQLNLAIPEAAINDSGPTVAELIARQQRNLEAIEVRALRDQAAVTTQNCPMYSSIYGGDRSRCRQECRVLRGAYDTNWTTDTCTYSEADVANCNPNSGVICCESVHGGSWNEGDEGTGICSGATEGRTALRLSCGIEGRAWDEVRNYCLTASCNINIDANCCSAQGNSWMNNSCVMSDITPTEEVQPLPDSTVSEIQNNLSGLPTELQNSIIQRAQDNIGNNLLTANNNAEIRNEQGAESIVLSASLPANISSNRRALIENTIDVVCSDVRTNATYSRSGVVTGSLANGTAYIACVR